MNTACYLMAPYPNRIKNRLMRFHGARIELEHWDQHALHGYIQQSSPTSYSYDEHEFSAEFLQHKTYPCPYRFLIKYALNAHTLTITCAIRNEGIQPFPFGGGLHPFFPVHLTEEGSEPLLQFQTNGYYPAEQELPFPLGDAVPVTSDLDWSRPAPLRRGLDTCFSGWEGNAELYWPKERVHVALKGNSSLGHLVIYSPHDENRFAFEPQTQMINGVNFLDSTYRDHGVRLLEPGESLDYEVSVAVSLR